MKTILLLLSLFVSVSSFGAYTKPVKEVNNSTPTSSKEVSLNGNSNFDKSSNSFESYETKQVEKRSKEIDFDKINNKKLKLTTEDIQYIEHVAAGNNKVVEKVTQEKIIMNAKRDEIKAIVSSKNPDWNRVKMLNRELAALRADHTTLLMQQMYHNENVN